jgi:hypothetical protein
MIAVAKLMLALIGLSSRGWGSPSVRLTTGAGAPARQDQRPDQADHRGPQLVSARVPHVQGRGLVRAWNRAVQHHESQPAGKTNNQTSFGSSLLKNNMEVQAAMELQRHLDETGVH